MYFNVNFNVFLILKSEFFFFWGGGVSELYINKISLTPAHYFLASSSFGLHVVMLRKTSLNIGHRHTIFTFFYNKLSKCFYMK